MSSRAVVIYRPETTEALHKEYLDNLSRKRIFVTDAPELAERERCELRIVHPVSGAEIAVEAEAVWVQPGVGVGLDLQGLEGTRKDELAAFVAAGSEQKASESVDASSGEESSEEEPESTFGDAEATDDERGRARNLYDKVRQLSGAEREAMARSGGLTERVALERCFKGAVWEGLLHNPQVTPREVAHIAKNVSVPVPLLNLIVGSAAWMSRPEVQRALLNNPRLSGVLLDRVLKSLSKADLSAAANSARPQVRSQAKKLLGQ